MKIDEITRISNPAEFLNEAERDKDFVLRNVVRVDDGFVVEGKNVHYWLFAYYRYWNSTLLVSDQVVLKHHLETIPSKEFKESRTHSARDSLANGLMEMGFDVRKGGKPDLVYRELMWGRPMG